jgi:lysozyme family protein
MSVALQKAINRYANAASFALLAEDGTIGPKTAAALIRSLDWLQKTVPAARDTSVALIKRLVTDSGAFNYTQMKSSADGLTIYLSQQADDAGFPQTPAAPTIQRESTSQSVAQAENALTSLQLRPPGMAASLSSVFNRLPRWAPYAGGAAFALGALALIAMSGAKHGQKVKGKHKAGKPAHKSASVMGW